MIYPCSDGLIDILHILMFVNIHVVMAVGSFCNVLNLFYRKCTSGVMKYKDIMTANVISDVYFLFPLSSTCRSTFSRASGIIDI